MDKEKEYLMLIADLRDIRQQLTSLLRHQVSVGEEIRTNNEKYIELNKEFDSKPKESVTLEDLDKIDEAKNNSLVLNEIFDMCGKMCIKKSRKELEIQKRIEQYCKRHNKDLPSFIKKKN